MDIDFWFSIIVFIVLLLFSAFFSGSESAYFSLSQMDLHHLKDEKEKSPASRRILSLLARPRRLLIGILLGNTLVNVAAATVIAISISPVFVHLGIGHQAAVILEIMAVTLVILVLSEVSPKVFAVRQPLRFAAAVSLPLKIIITFFTPLTWFFDKMTHGLSAVMGVKGEPSFITEEELKTLIKVGEDKGTLDKAEREMIHSIFEFRETMVKEVMVPRIDMVCVEKQMPVEAVLNLVREKGHSRIPVYDDKVDNIRGILHVKDLLPYLKEKRTIPPLESLVRNAYFVPESKLIDELLKEFQNERTHMAIVVDEYGGTAGLVTLEDVIEEIVGEIRDEYDKEKPLIQKLDDTTWSVDGKISIEDLNDELGLSIPVDEDYESLGGFIFSLLGRIPEEKEKVHYKGLRLIVEKVHRRRITKVRIVLVLPRKKEEIQKTQEVKSNGRPRNGRKNGT